MKPSNRFTPASAGKVRDYVEYNFSLEKKYVFQYGMGGGFCAETIGLLRRVVSCAQLKYQFSLGPAGPSPRGFAIEKGWEDYFMSIFPKVEGKLLPLLNRNYFPWHITRVMRRVAPLVLRVIYGNHYFAFDHLESNDDPIDINGLQISHNYWQKMKSMLEIIWCTNPKVRDRIEEYKRRVNLPEKYYGMHIRRGDKISEAPFLGIEKYIHAMESVAEKGAPIYLATDDSAVVETVRNSIKNVKVYNSLNNRTRGYDQSDFNRKDKRTRFDETVYFLYELELLANSEWFVGAAPSNVFYLLRYMRANENMIDAGCNQVLKTAPDH